MIKISKKRTCNNCRAISLDTCELRYKTKIKYFDGIPVGLIPQESCPKPLTDNEWLECRKYYMKD